ncbi:uncharacterized protein LOC110181109 [Drosophila serrata]|uniref:uncharacterized protein LOC110181109 n=1 Tax=Drosophila serrata TaxID=7274 RepID=UPI000A1D09E5|nr:uncharacterized protein LOC110181109 [Drosophila serrata]
MLRGAGKTFLLVKSSDVLVKNWFKNSPNTNGCVYNYVKILNRNWRPYSFALNGLQDNRCLESKHGTRLHVDADKKARIMALIKRIRSFQGLINERKKDRLTEKSKIVLENLLIVLNDMEKALRELRQLL